MTAGNTVNIIYAATGFAQGESRGETDELWMLISQSCFLSIKDYFSSLFFLMRTANPDWGFTKFPLIFVVFLVFFFSLYGIVILIIFASP